MNECCYMTISLTVFHCLALFLYPGQFGFWALVCKGKIVNVPLCPPPPPPHTPFRTKSQSKKAVCNANSLKARPCSFLLKVECCPGASWTLRAPCSPLGNFLRAVFSQVEKHLSFRKFQQQLLAFSELLWSAAILQGDVPRRHVGLA